MRTNKILIIEDDQTLNEQLASMLREKAYQVDQCFDGEAGLAQAVKQQHHLILLDVMLPKRDGFSVLNMLRKTSRAPVIMLTAMGAEEERIKGFYSGVDDYLAKPFNTTELMLRIEAILRRCQAVSESEVPGELSLDGLFINRIEQTVFAHNLPIELTPIQFELLWTVLLHRGEVLSKAFLYQTVLNRSYCDYDRSLDMHLSRLRRKLTAADWRGERLRVVHGKGYCLQ